MLIILSEEGLGLVEEAFGAHVEGEERPLDSTGGEDRGRLAALLRELLVSMEGAESNEGKPSGVLRE